MGKIEETSGAGVNGQNVAQAIRGIRHALIVANCNGKGQEQGQANYCVGYGPQEQPRSSFLQPHSMPFAW
jgi:hypothetical protein